MKKSQSMLMKLVNNSISQKIARAIMSIYNVCEDIIYVLLSLPLYFVILRKKIKKDPTYLKNKLNILLKNTSDITSKYYRISHNLFIKYAIPFINKLRHSSALSNALRTIGNSIKTAANSVKIATTSAKQRTINTVQNIKKWTVAKVKVVTYNIYNALRTLGNIAKEIAFLPINIYLCSIRIIKTTAHNLSCNIARTIKRYNKPINISPLSNKLKHALFCKNSQIYILSAIALVVVALSVKWYNNQLAAVHEQYNIIASKMQNATQLLHNINNANNKTNALSENSKQNEAIYDPVAALKHRVETYFAQHTTTEVLASNDKCRIKVDNEVIDDHSEINGLADIRISGANEDYITFTDNAGNFYAKPIITLFQ